MTVQDPDGMLAYERTLLSLPAGTPTIEVDKVDGYTNYTVTVVTTSTTNDTRETVGYVFTPPIGMLSPMLCFSCFVPVVEPAVCFQHSCNTYNRLLEHNIGLSYNPIAFELQPTQCLHLN